MRSENEPRNLIDLELDAVSGENEHLVHKRNRHAIREQLRVHSHLRLLSQFLSFCLLLRLTPLRRYQNPPPRCFDFGLGWEFTESDTSLKLFPRSDQTLQHLPAFRNLLECNLYPILFSYLSFFLHQSFFIFLRILFTDWETLSTKVTLVNRNSFIIFCTNFTSIKSRKNEYKFFNIYLKS